MNEVEVRVGDVVQLPGQPHTRGRVHAVTPSLNPDRGAAHWRDSSGEPVSAHGRMSVQFFARPVQVGDRLRPTIDDIHAPWTVIAIGDAGWNVVGSKTNGFIYFTSASAYRHENGLQIDVPEAKPSQSPDYLPPRYIARLPSFEDLLQACDEAGRSTLLPASLCHPEYTPPRALSPITSTLSLARRLWLADPEVRRLLEEKGDITLRTVTKERPVLQYEGQPLNVTVTHETSAGFVRKEQVEARAWERDWNKLRTKWIDVARKAFEMDEMRIAHLESDKELRTRCREKLAGLK